MKIKGYVPPDPKVALEVGVELNYKSKYGDLNFRIKSTGKDNVDFRKANEKLTNKRNAQVRTGFQASEEDQMRDTLGLWFDHVVINWSTTVVDEETDAPIPSNRANFIAILSQEVFVPVFIEIIRESGEAENFTKAAEETASKN